MIILLHCVVPRSQATQADNRDRQTLTTLSLTRANSYPLELEFKQSLYVLSVVESTPVGATLIKLATNRPNQETLKFSILANIPPSQLLTEEARQSFKMMTIYFNQFFQIRGGDLILRRSLDYETRPAFSFNVSVGDGRRYASTTVNVTVLDVNDHDPVFSQEEYEFVVTSEKLKPGLRLGQVVVEDGDVGDLVSLHLAGPHSSRALPISSNGRLVEVDQAAEEANASSRGGEYEQQRRRIRAAEGANTSNRGGEYEQQRRRIRAAEEANACNRGGEYKQQSRRIRAAEEANTSSRKGEYEQQRRRIRAAEGANTSSRGGEYDSFDVNSDGIIFIKTLNGLRLAKTHFFIIAKDSGIPPRQNSASIVVVFPEGLVSATFGQEKSLLILIVLGILLGILFFVILALGFYISKQKRGGSERSYGSGMSDMESYAVSGKFPRGEKLIDARPTDSLNGSHRDMSMAKRNRLLNPLAHNGQIPNTQKPLGVASRQEQFIRPPQLSTDRNITSSPSFRGGALSRASNGTQALRKNHRNSVNPMEQLVSSFQDKAVSTSRPPSATLRTTALDPSVSAAPVIGSEASQFMQTVYF
ncbi:unnamed protein product [Cyprideis torosa]|uniref:Uncharacterized protein n=1 Tax=Cyprideis torosa TaxID=163714 RepID=A0A7R8ZMC5_9CRUS|nr:unnamed protein product [Cyprideis torosa]CAG0895249.1 unnamed protein product [Cyprideis torosa]